MDSMGRALTTLSCDTDWFFLSVMLPTRLAATKARTSGVRPAFCWRVVENGRSDVAEVHAFTRICFDLTWSACTYTGYRCKQKQSQSCDHLTDELPQVESGRIELRSYVRGCPFPRSESLSTRRNSRHDWFRWTFASCLRSFAVPSPSNQHVSA